MRRIMCDPAGPVNGESCCARPAVVYVPGMHELGLAQAIVEQVEAVLAREPGASLRVIRIRIGAISGVAHESLAFALPLVMAGTRLEGARVDFELVPARVRCGRCGQESVPALYAVQCRHCGALEVAIVSGRELAIQAVEIETPA